MVRAYNGPMVTSTVVVKLKYEIIILYCNVVRNDGNETLLQYYLLPTYVDVVRRQAVCRG